MLTAVSCFKGRWLSRLVARSLRDHFNISGNEATVHDLNGRKLLCGVVKGGGGGGATIDNVIFIESYV